MSQQEPTKPTMSYQSGGSSCYNSGDWNTAVYGGFNQHAVSATDQTIAMNNPNVGGKRRRRRHRRKTARGGYKLSSRKRQTKRSSRRG
jgi:hypothetical protein